jgi:Arc/MetJ-type ribon-helix-helix transcriptional regulator
MIRYEKIAVSLPSRAAETAREAVRRGEATSVSAYVATAIEEKAERETLKEFLDEMLAETGGPITAAERRWGERVLGIKRSKRKRPTRRRKAR